MCLTVDTNFIFTKKSNVAKYFFDISNAEISQVRQKLDVILDYKIEVIKKCILQKNVVLNSSMIFKASRA